MAHFAQVTDGIVQQVIVVSNDDCGGGNFPDSEPIGQAFIASLGLAGDWLQTSYHANFRAYYAGIGYTFDSTNDVFIPVGYTYDPDTDTFTPPPTPEADDENL